MDEILADDLLKKDEELCKKQTIIYEDVLKKCYSKIKISNNIKKQKECIFEIPQIIYGHPRFDIEACMIFIIIKLKNNGFKAKQKSETEIKISWKPKESDKKKEIKKNIKEREEEKKSKRKSIKSKSKKFKKKVVAFPGL